MKTNILYIFTRTPLHVGAGSSIGAIYQPVQRECHTGFPVIPGSGLKGVLADNYNDVDENGKILIDEERNTSKRTDKGSELFGLGPGKTEGDNGQTGAISFGEGQLLAFPVRSAKGCFAWLTSPLALKRWQRVSNIVLDDLPENIGEEEAYFCADTLGQTMNKKPHTSASALFEDYVFTHKGACKWAKSLQTNTKVDGLWSDMAERHLVLVNDGILSHFARTACEVAQHVVINDETGTAKEGLLFNQENVPSETLFFSTLTENKADTLHDLTVPNPIQLGGGATTGLGFCSTALVSPTTTQDHE